MYFMSVNATFAVAARTRKVSRRPCTCPTTGNILILHKTLLTPTVVTSGPGFAKPISTCFRDCCLLYTLVYGIHVYNLIMHAIKPAERSVISFISKVNYELIKNMVGHINRVYSVAVSSYLTQSDLCDCNNTALS